MPVTIRGLVVPELLVALVESGRWRHPGETIVRSVVPTITDPVDFYQSVAALKRGTPMFLAHDPRSSALFHEYRGAKASDRPDLPWLDLDRAFFIAINRFPGDDVAIALDYRSDAADPRVVASEWTDDGCRWREVAPTFSQFVHLIGL